MRRLLAIFRRRPAPPPAVPPCEHWHPGDIAMCIEGGAWRSPVGEELASGPVLHECYRVAGVAEGRPLPGLTGLTFTRWPGLMFNAHCFRKVQPRADQATAADAAFIRQLRPARRPAPVPAAGEPT